MKGLCSYCGRDHRFRGLALSFRGQRHTEATRRKMSASSKAAWERRKRQRARVGTPKPATPTIPSPKADPAAKP